MTKLTKEEILEDITDKILIQKSEECGDLYERRFNPEKLAEFLATLNP